MNYKMKTLNNVSENLLNELNSTFAGLSLNDTTKIVKNFGLSIAKGSKGSEFTVRKSWDQQHWKYTFCHFVKRKKLANWAI